MKRLILGIFLAVLWCGNRAGAQDIAVKTNLLYWGTTTPNLGFEFGLGKKTSLDLLGGYNPFNLDKGKNKKMKHWLVMPEFRYWLCERFNGHFFGLHAGFSEYNVSGVRLPLPQFPKRMKDHRYEGWGMAFGLSYGYSWILGRRWNLEATVGAGYLYGKYDVYDCVKCGDFRGSDKKSRFGITKAGLSLVYLIK